MHHDYLIATCNGERRPIIEANHVDLPPIIPMLNSVLEITKGRVELEIELKGCSAQFIEAVLAEIQRHDAMEQVEYTSPHPYVLSYLRSREKKVRLGMFVSPFPE